MKSVNNYDLGNTWDYYDDRWRIIQPLFSDLIQYSWAGRITGTHLVLIDMWQI